MRHAIYRSIGEENLQILNQEIPLTKENGKEIFESLKRYFPIFALFQSDRPSRDDDPEVQNPMKIAIEQALEGLESELDAIVETVRNRAEETASSTLEKLQQSYPDMATNLTPNFKRPNWRGVFKLDLESDEGIPLNKRGSGVRRLILMNFFQAEAERKRDTYQENEIYKRPIVYAIEEPETSQHPDQQQRIIEILKDVALHDQVIFTTHVPALAGLVPIENLRFLSREGWEPGCRVQSYAENDSLLSEISDAVGVLPDPIRKDSVEVAVLVEGKTDIGAIQSMISILSQEEVIQPIDDRKIFWTIGGGCRTLKDWVERRYIERLGIPMVILQDSDLTESGYPPSPEKEKWNREMNERPDVRSFITKKRSMDNYVHPSAIFRATNGRITINEGQDADFGRIANIFSEQLRSLRALGKASGFSFYPTDYDGSPITKTDSSACKRIIAAYVMRSMTCEEILERTRYDKNGEHGHEIIDWVEAIRSFMQ